MRPTNAKMVSIMNKFSIINIVTNELLLNSIQLDRSPNIGDTIIIKEHYYFVSSKEYNYDNYLISIFVKPNPV